MGDLESVLKDIGLSDERSRADGGLYSSAELVAKVKGYDAEDDVEKLLRRITPHIEPTRAHEILHCFDVGFGAAALVKQVMEDEHARQKLGISDLSNRHIRAALLSGLFHDMVLGFRGKSLEEATSLDVIAGYVHPDNQDKVKAPQYLKDAIGDDIRGAILIGRYGSAIENAQIAWIAMNELFAGADLKLSIGPSKILGQFSPYKILDAIWYHDGNSPVRGAAEVDALIGDRVRLYNEGKLGLDAIAAGVQKVLGYTEPDPKWEERDTVVDVPYLKRMIEKKAGPFLDAIKGTQTYDFVVEEIAAQQRGRRTINSNAFYSGVAQAPVALALLGENIPGTFSRELATLWRRYEAVMNYCK